MTSLFWVLIEIYGVGCLFTLMLGLRIWAYIIAEGPILKALLNGPLVFCVSIYYSLRWPVELFKDYNFRDIVVECGRIFVIFGYLAAAIFTFVYPKIWFWYIGFCIIWKILENYHEKTKPTQPREQDPPPSSAEADFG